MFNQKLKKEALNIHEEATRRYNTTRDKLMDSCQDLHNVRVNSVELIKYITAVINSIANTPKSFETDFGKVRIHLDNFKETTEYAERAYKESVRAGVGIAGAATIGVGVAAMAPTALMSIATTFGTATTGKAISALYGAAAEKAAVAWIGRTVAGFAVKEGAGLAVGQAVLSLAGPIGWTVTGASIGIELASLTKKNKELANTAVEEAKNITTAREALDEAVDKVVSLRSKTGIIYNDLNLQKSKINTYKNIDYLSLAESDKEFLGALVNNTLSLSELLNKTIE